MSRTVVFELEPTRSGLGLNEDVSMQIKALHGKDILSLSGNGLGDNVLITTRDGTVLFHKGHSLQSVPWQNCVELESKNVSYIDSSDNYHVGLNESGDVFTWKDEVEEIGDPRDESIYSPLPKMLNMSLKVVQVSCGKRHTVCLTEEGRLGVWGSNSEGQLGLGRRAGEFYTEPQFIDCLKGIMFIQVVAGGYHTMALSGSSAVFGWGRNSSGQLGTSRKDKQMGPASCPDVRSKKIKFISCGEDHTAMLSTDGIVFSFGLDFQDGNGEVPHGEIQFLRDKPVSSIACGFHHTVAFVTETWQAFVFGRGQKEVSLAHLVAEDDFHFEKNIEISCSTGSTLFTTHNRTFVHVCTLQRRDVVPETIDKMLLLERINSTSPLYRSDEYLNQKLMISLSSSSCLNGSFLSNDTRHCECSRLKGHGIDMEAVTSFFGFLKDKSLQYDSVSTTVKEALQKLLSELPDDPCHIEALRLYLIVSFCHLMEDGSMTFLEPFVNSWMGLNNDSQKILNQWLKTLPVEYFTRYLEILTKAVCELLPKFKDMCRDTKTILTSIYSCVRVIDKLYKINEERNDPKILNQWLTTLPVECFTRYLEVLITAVCELLPTFKDAQYKDTKTIPTSVYSCVRVTDKLFKISEERSDQNTLNQWLKTLPFQQFKTYLEVLMKSLCKLLPKYKDTFRDTKTIPAIIQSCVGVIDKLYKINEEKGDQIQWQEFYVKELLPTINIQEDYILSLKDLEQKHESFRFCKFPFLYNPESKGVLLKSHNTRAMDNALMTLNHICGPSLDMSPFAFIVNRDRIIEETRQNVASLRTAHEHMHKMKLTVVFEGENAGGQGVFQEFFTLLFDRLLQQDLFHNEEESNLLWFKPQTLGGLELLKFLGFMLGLAVYNGKLVNLQFPLAMYKKLLDVPLTFADFEDLKPGVAKSLKEYILGEEINEEFFFEDVVEMEGKMVSKNLCENGAERLVTTDNKQEYIDLKVDFQLNKSIEQEFEYFRQGFFEAIDKTVLRELKFQPTELQAVIVGKENFDVRELKRTARYEAGYHTYHPVIMNLWKILTAMEVDDRKLFIRFITGTERIPSGGLNLVIMPLEREGEDTDDLIPIVATCSNVLFLPSIEDPDRLKNRLYQAIGNKESTGKNRFTSLNEALGIQP